MIQQPRRGCGRVSMRAKRRNPFRVVGILFVQPRVVPTLSGQPWAEGRCPVGAFRMATADVPERGSVTRSGLKARQTGEVGQPPVGGRAATLRRRCAMARQARAALRRSRDGNARGALGGGGFGVGGHKSLLSVFYGLGSLRSFQFSFLARKRTAFNVFSFSSLGSKA